MACNGCDVCGPGAPHRGRGRVADPKRRWWQFWKMVDCSYCGGSGFHIPTMLPIRKLPDVRPSIKPRVTILHSSCAGEHFAVVDVDCKEIGRIPIVVGQTQKQEFWDALSSVIIKCVDGR